MHVQPCMQTSRECHLCDLDTRKHPAAGALRVFLPAQKPTAGVCSSSTCSFPEISLSLSNVYMDNHLDTMFHVITLRYSLPAHFIPTKELLICLSTNTPTLYQHNSCSSTILLGSHTHRFNNIIHIIHY